MAIIVKVSNPSALLTKIKAGINAKKIVTWSYDSDGDFTHETLQWKNKAWLRPKVYLGELRFGILGPNNVKLPKEVYAIYHGRFIEMLLAHFDTDFTVATATSQKTEPDNFQ